MKSDQIFIHMNWQPEPAKTPVIYNPVEEGKSFLQSMRAHTSTISFCREYSKKQLRRIRRLRRNHVTRLGRTGLQ